MNISDISAKARQLQALEPPQETICIRSALNDPHDDVINHGSLQLGHDFEMLREDVKLNSDTVWEAWRQSARIHVGYSLRTGSAASTPFLPRCLY